jgi:CheY-like chemotaxis protein
MTVIRAAPVPGFSRFPRMGEFGARSRGEHGVKAELRRPMEGGTMTTGSSLGRVLVVDDEEDIRSMLGIVLSTEGWDVDEAADGREALLRCAAGRYDLVVLDLRMPELSGLEVAHHLVAGGFDGRLVLFSAFVDDDVERECAEIGMAVVDKVDWYGLVDACRAVAPARAG